MTSKSVSKSIQHTSPRQTAHGVRERGAGKRNLGDGPFAGVLTLQGVAGNTAIHGLLSADAHAGKRMGLPADVRSVVGRSDGQPLDPETRRTMELRFQHDFSNVRVHTGAEASRSAQAVNASAYTVGQHIVFDAGQYAPGDSNGKRLLAHELAHVTQANRAGVRAGVSAPGDASEREAARAGDAVAQGGRVQALSAPTAAIARQPKKPAVQVKTKTFEEVQKILEKTATGREALEMRKKLKVTVKMSFGGIGYFPGPSNTIVLDMTETPVFLALAFVHEMNHAKMAHASKPSSERAKGMTKDDFVQSMLKEEAESDVRTYDAKHELQGTDVDLTGALPNPKDKLEEMYRTTILDSAIRAQIADPKVSGAQMKQISQAAGTAAVVGRYQTGPEGAGHKKHYEKQWEEANKGKVKSK